MLEADFRADRRHFPVEMAVTVAPGERLALFGPSGAGKTTTLEVIAGLLRPRWGRVILSGRVLVQTEPPRQSLPPWRRRVGLLRQYPGLFPHLTVGENLSFGTRGEAGPTGGGAGQVTQLATRLGIAGLLAERPAGLSGGQAHRVALGRLLLARCEALLLDEPYTGLDAGLRQQLGALVAEVVSERELPAVLVTHDLADAQAFASELAVLDEGRLLQRGGPAEVVARPASRRAAELVGYRGFVPVAPGPGPTGWVAAAAETGTASASGVPEVAQRGAAGAPDGTAVAGIHPERVVPGAYPERGLVLTGPVMASRPAGAGWEADLATAGGAVTVRLPHPPGGRTVAVTAMAAPCFGADGVLLPPGVRA